MAWCLLNETQGKVYPFPLLCMHFIRKSKEMQRDATNARKIVNRTRSRYVNIIFLSKKYFREQTIHIVLL
jgi:hypothetical protein